MNLFLATIILLGISFIVFLKLTFPLGAKKAIQGTLGLLIPIILSGTAIHIGNILLPKSLNISYYLAGIGTTVFYIVLNPIINKENPDRYRKITKESKYIGSIIRCFQFWLFCSFLFFYLDLIFLPDNPNTATIIHYIKLPIHIFWFFT